MSIPNTLPQRSTTVQTIVPVENDGTQIDGVIIDRLGYQSAKLVISYAASTGSPTTSLAAISFYSNTASSTSGATLLVALETVKNVKAAGVAQYDIDLSGAHRYVYPVVDITYADGSSPKNLISAVLVLGDKYIQPANSSTVYGR
jgi:hypothetical protein